MYSHAAILHINNIYIIYIELILNIIMTNIYIIFVGRRFNMNIRI